jgi:hypothetical protein
LPCEQAERRRQAFPSAQVELLQGHGHWVMLENPRTRRLPGDPVPAAAAAGPRDRGRITRQPAAEFVTLQPPAGQRWRAECFSVRHRGPRRSSRLVSISPGTCNAGGRTAGGAGSAGSRVNTPWSCCGQQDQGW